MVEMWVSPWQIAGNIAGLFVVSFAAWYFVSWIVCKLKGKDHV